MRNLPPVAVKVTAVSGLVQVVGLVQKMVVQPVVLMLPAIAHLVTSFILLVKLIPTLFSFHT